MSRQPKGNDDNWTQGALAERLFWSASGPPVENERFQNQSNGEARHN